MPRDVYNELRKLFIQEYKVTNPQLFAQLGSKEFYAHARKHFAEKCTPRQKKMYLSLIGSREAKTDEEILLQKNAEACLAVLSAAAERPACVESKVKAHVCILVYNDDKFVYDRFKCENVKDCLEEDVLVETLSNDADVVRLCDYFFKFVQEKAEQSHYDWACSVEVSPNTYYEQGICRLHLTVCLGRPKDPIVFLSPWAQMKFDHVVPVYMPKCGPLQEAMMMKRKGYSRSLGEAVYYVVMPKVLKVASRSGKVPFKDFPIHQTTITSYLQVVHLIASSFYFHTVSKQSFLMSGRHVEQVQCVNIHDIFLL